VDSIFGRADHNKDGKLTKNEVPAFIWERLSQSDADKDGAVTKSEMEAHIKQRMPEKKPDGKKPDGGQKTDASDKPAAEPAKVIAT
jgi:hypothetical protein